jgi:methylglyoxal synthase
MCGTDEVPKFGRTAPENDFVGVKAPMFSFQRLKGADPSLGVEMASTGEVACMGPTKYDAFLKSLMSTGMKLPRQNILVSIQDRERNEGTLKSLQTFSDLGYKLFATEKTAAFLDTNGVPVTQLDYPTETGGEGGDFCIDDYIARGDIHLVLMFSNQYSKRVLSNYAIRRLAVDYNVPLITNIQVSQMLAESLREAGARATGDEANDKVLGDSRSLSAWYES